MAHKRLTRFLIDRVDERLGDVKKEKKFDLTVIAISVVIIIVGFVLAISDPAKPVSNVIGLILLILGVFVLYTMVKEYIDDCKKEKDQASK